MSTSRRQYGRTLFSSGSFMPIGVAFVQETTVFREYGPLAGNTVRVGYEYAPSARQALCRGRRPTSTRATTCGSPPTACWRSARAGFKSWGEFPGYMYFGGNSELRGYDYLEFLGNKAFFLNGELRFPLIEAALTPLGVIGGLRGIAFAGIGAAGYEGMPDESVHARSDHRHAAARVRAELRDLDLRPGLRAAADDQRVQAGRRPRVVRLGLETFALGFPIHFDWSWRTLLNKDYEDYVFAYQGIQEGMTGSKWFRKPRFSIWIGYDF